jgi:hypothetical protein
MQKPNAHAVPLDPMRMSLCARDAMRDGMRSIVRVAPALGQSRTIT